MTIRRKLTLLLAGLLALVVVVFGVVTVQIVRWAMIASIDNSLYETARQIAVNSSAFPLTDEWAGTTRIQVVLPSLDIFRASGVYVQVWRHSMGRIEPELVAASTQLHNYALPLDYNGLGSKEQHISNVILNGAEWRILTSPVYLTPTRDTLFANIQTAASLETVNQTTNRLLGIMAISSIVALIGVAGMSLWFSQRALKPIGEITQAASRIAEAQDLGTRLKWRGPMDELGRLVSVFNHMMERLEHLFSLQQRFVADVSHELRTPLTSVRGNIELIKRYGVDSDSLEAIDSETARMSRMVDDLLLLARADYGGLKLDLYPLDLDTVISGVYQQSQVLARNAGVTLTMAHFEPVRVKGNADRIKQLTLNLLHNAIKFTPEGGTVTLSLTQSAGIAIIEVSDTGIGITKENLMRIFDRFYQADPSRSKEGMGGSGLGLSIARWIAEAHEGSITVESVPGRGSTFKFRMQVYKYASNEKEDERRARLPIVNRVHEPER